MSDTNGQEFADAFGLETDPLEIYWKTFAYAFALDAMKAC